LAGAALHLPVISSFGGCLSASCLAHHNALRLEPLSISIWQLVTQHAEKLCFAQVQRKTPNESLQLTKFFREDNGYLFAGRHYRRC